MHQNLRPIICWSTWKDLVVDDRNWLNVATDLDDVDLLFRIIEPTNKHVSRSTPTQSESRGRLVQYLTKIIDVHVRELSTEEQHEFNSYTYMTSSL
jgi:hypothetical protein